MVSTTPTAVGEPDLLDIILELNGRDTMHGPAGSRKGDIETIRSEGSYSITTEMIIVFGLFS
jgi:hypothetical protein